MSSNRQFADPRFFDAIRSNDLTALKLAVQGQPSETLTSPEGVPALHEALVSHGDAAMINYLIQLGAGVRDIDHC